MNGQENKLTSLRLPVFIAGAILLAAGVLGGFLSHQLAIFYRGYLAGFLFCVGIGIGSLALLMIQYLTGGAWGVIIRRPLEAARNTLALAAVMFIPILFGMHELYIWSNPERVLADPLLQHKQPYLNVTFFIIRAVFYFAVWVGLALFMSRTARSNERDNSPLTALRLRYMSGLGLLLLALTVTFSAIDWAMSLDPHWFSTMYGLSFIVGSILSALAFSVFIVTMLAGTRPLSDVIVSSVLRDLGNLMFAFIMLWAYLSFSQFLLIWYANLREEVTWYEPRMYGAWGWVSGFLILFHFFIPFFLLLNRGVKDRAKALRAVAALVVVMHLVDLIWTIVPSAPVPGGHGGHGEGSVNVLHWIDLVTSAGLVLVWFGFFLTRLRAHDLVPMNEPYVREALSHG